MNSKFYLTSKESLYKLCLMSIANLALTIRLQQQMYLTKSALADAP